MKSTKLQPNSPTNSLVTFWLQEKIFLPALQILTLLVIGSNSPASHAREISPACQAELDGRNVNLVVTRAPGGGHDQYGRIIAPILSEFSGVNSRVTNVVGANGLLGVRTVALADDNAISIGLFEHERLIFPLEYGLQDFHPLGIFARENEAWVGRKGIRLEEYVGQRLVAAASDILPAASRLGLAARSMGIELKTVAGYSGSADSMAAIVRGEVDVVASSVTTVLRAIENEEIVPLVILSDRPDNKLEGVPHLAGAGGLAEKFSRNLSEQEQQRMMQHAEIVANHSDSIRGLFVSYNISAALRNCLTQAVESVIFSEQFATATAAVGRPIFPISSVDATSLLNSELSSVSEFNSLFAEVLAELLE